MNAVATAQDFDFTNQSDEDLRVTTDVWAPENAASPEWAELYAVGRRAVIEEAHRRALAVHRWAADVVCYAHDSHSGVSWGDFFTFVGTAEEFMAKFGVRPGRRAVASAGELRGSWETGEIVRFSWVQEW